MNHKNVSFKEEPQLRHTSSDRLPSLLKLRNVTNQPDHSQLQLLKNRVDQLQAKISQLESKIKMKRKRIRRKSSQVQKHHFCRQCGRRYGSLVSLNLHIRKKHQKQQESQQQVKEQSDQERNHSESQQPQQSKQ